MKYSRRMASAALAAVLAAGMVVPAAAAKVGEVVNYALHTDIVAQINGHALRSYNVNNRTAVVAEDLSGYGFRVTWDPQERSLAVERAMDEAGAPKNPVKYPVFEQEELNAPVGSRAEEILSTDIVTYVAGHQVESFNIDGQTLIWLSDLVSYGDVLWDAENRIANVVLGDPMEHSLEQVVKQIVDWAGDQAEYQLYKGEKGTLFVGYYNGTTHGTACVMEYVDKAGKRTRIDQLFPGIGYGFGAQYYIRPRNIMLGTDSLTFTTTYQAASGGAGEWTDHVMTIDLNSMELVYTQPVHVISPSRLDSWDYTFAPAADTQLDPTQPLIVKLQKKAGTKTLEVVECSVPFPGIEVQVTHSKVVVTVGNRTNDNYQGTPYGTAYYALAKAGIPSMFRETEERAKFEATKKEGDVYEGYVFKPGNTETQRKNIRTMFRVMIGEEYVNGALSWVGRNGKRCLWYDFDRLQTLEEGEVITVKMGLPL